MDPNALKFNPALVIKYRKLVDDLKARILAEDGITVDEIFNLVNAVPFEIASSASKLPLKSFLAASGPINYVPDAPSPSDAPSADMPPATAAPTDSEDGKSETTPPESSTPSPENE